MAKTITFVLPDWAVGRRVVVLAGMEEVAHKEPGGPLMVKVSRCSRCGLCCDGCEHLIDTPGEETKMCDMGDQMPTACASSDGHGAHVLSCTVKWK